ncbi:hypothetical protein PENTCL1PPCAC_5135, partial [Pristionchus entomophagus]
SMETSVNLDTLPPDIIRRIIRMEEESAIEWRLICRLWNRVIIGYFSERKQKLVAERVYMFAGVAEHANGIDFMRMGVRALRRYRQEKERVHMYAIIRERAGSRVGVAKWLTVNQRY